MKTNHAQQTKLIPHYVFSIQIISALLCTFYPNIRFLDPEGNKIELWEPVDEVYHKMLGVTMGE